MNCVLVFCAFIGIQSRISSSYGVNPEKLSLYNQSSAQWNCLTSGLPIPGDQINDNFCDCDDGTDEPGTAACSHTDMTFYCENKGFLQAEIPTGHVNDGLCDCCDGSDEYSGVTNCQNTCKESRLKYYEKLKKDVEDRNFGFNLRHQYITNYHSSPAKNPQQLESLYSELELLNQSIALYQKCLSQLHDNTRDVYDCPSDVFSAEKETDYNDIEEENPSGHSLAEDDEWYSEDGQRHTRERRPHDFDLILCREAGRLVSDIEDSTMLDPQTFSQLIVSSDAEEMKEKTKNFVDFVFYSLESELSGAAVKDNIANWKSTYCAVFDSRPSVDEQINHVNKKLDSLMRESEAIHKQINNADFVAKFDLGDGAFYELLGKCYEFSKSFRFEFCPFYWVTHSDFDGSNVVNLGNFSGWNHKGDVEMFFTMGDYCQDGPFRSTKVDFVCGHYNEIKSVEETEYCVYHIVMKTPAVCPAIVFEEEARKVFGDSFINDEL